MDFSELYERHKHNLTLTHYALLYALNSRFEPFTMLRLIVEEVLELWGPQNCIETDTSFFGLSLSFTHVKMVSKETLQIISHI